jgi:maleate cis-trans isomerase
MKHLEIGSTLIATAYKETINQAVKKYYEDGGVNVLAIKGLEVARPVEQVKLPDFASYKVARELNRRHPVTDRLLIQGRWRSVAYVQELEDDTKKPVVSSTAASLWWVCTFSESKFRSKVAASFCGVAPQLDHLPEAVLAPIDARAVPRQ